MSTTSLLSLIGILYALHFTVLQMVRGGAPADCCGGCGAGGQPGGARPGHHQPPRAAQPQVSSSSLQPLHILLYHSKCNPNTDDWYLHYFIRICIMHR